MTKKNSMKTAATYQDASQEKPDPLAEMPYVRSRRVQLKDLGYWVGDKPEGDAAPVGVAFSGRGIRSATTSLGVVQALSRYKRFYGFDFMSSSSGGGYFACFLRSLYLPGQERETNAPKPPRVEEASDGQRYAYCKQQRKKWLPAKEEVQKQLEEVEALEGKQQNWFTRTGKRIKHGAAKAWKWLNNPFPKTLDRTALDTALSERTMREQSWVVAIAADDIAKAQVAAQNAIITADIERTAQSLEEAKSRVAKVKSACDELVKCVASAKEKHEIRREEGRKKRFHFANDVLNGAPGNKVLQAADIMNAKDPNTVIRHPLHWLREHGRYLAPGGAMDFASGVSLVVRNWLGLMLTVALAFALVHYITQMGFVWADWVSGNDISNVMSFELSSSETCSPCPESGAPMSAVNAGSADQNTTTQLQVSMWAIIAGGFAFLSLGAAAAYVIAHKMPYNPMSGHAQAKTAEEALVSAMTFVGLILVVSGVFARVLSNSPESFFDTVRNIYEKQDLGLIVFTPLWSAAFIGLLLILLGLLWIAYRTMKTVGTGGIFDRFQSFWKALTTPHGNKAQQLRRFLLDWQKWFNIGALVAIYLAVIDTFAMHLHREIQEVDAQDPVNSTIVSGILAVIIQPLAAYLIKKIPEAFGGSENPVVTFLRKRISIAALIAGAFLFSLTLLGTALLVHTAIWDADVWGKFDREDAVVFGMALGGLAFVFGTSNSLINLISLHTFYAARLTRAYLGATNLDRLELGVDANDRMDLRHDHIDSYAYFRTDLAAPWHLLNVTINAQFQRKTSSLATARGEAAPLSMMAFRSREQRIRGITNSTKPNGSLSANFVQSRGQLPRQGWGGLPRPVARSRLALQM